MGSVSRLHGQVQVLDLVWKLNPTCVARPGVDKVVGRRPPESY